MLNIAFFMHIYGFFGVIHVFDGMQNACACVLVCLCALHVWTVCMQKPEWNQTASIMVINAARWLLLFCSSFFLRDSLLLNRYSIAAEKSRVTMKCAWIAGERSARKRKKNVIVSVCILEGTTTKDP